MLQARVDVVRRQHNFPADELRDVFRFALLLLVVFVEEVTEDIGKFGVRRPTERFAEQHARGELLAQLQAQRRRQAVAAESFSPVVKVKATPP